MLLPLVLLLGAQSPLAASPLDRFDMLSKSTSLAELRAAAKAGFDMMDLDHDGFVTKAEILKKAEIAVDRFRAPGGPALSIPPIGLELFDKEDPNHDGRISLEEHLAGVDRQFALDDADHDGAVTTRERMASAVRAIEHIVDVARSGRRPRLQ